MNVIICNSIEPACDEYVRRQPSAKICHLPAWSLMLAKEGGYKQYYLVARDQLSIVGVLPLTHMKSMLFGDRLVSQAFSNYGGPLADGPETVESLYSRAVEMAGQLKCQSMEFRNTKRLPYDLPERENKICMVLTLNRDPEKVWKAFNPKVRNQVRKAEKAGLEAVNGGVELLAEFYRLYTIRMRQLGTPCFSSKMLRGILHTFSDCTRVFLVRQEDVAVAAGFVWWFNGLVEISWAATLLEYNNLCPNNLLYWSVIKHSCLIGASGFDFGRSTVGGGTYHFKKQWGPSPVELHYQYWMPPGKQFSPPNPENPKYQRKIEMWKRMPLWASRLLGPRISWSLC
jgi:serine/alanine adding enzyme